jgi:phage terminase Nu1 subunit (DNA packaging protein)
MTKRTKTITVTRSELADLLAVTPDSITRYIASGMPVLSTGSGRGRRTTFDLREALRWWISSDGDARERLLTLQADRIALDLELKRGGLMSVEEVSRDFASVATATKARLRRIPDATAEMLVFAAKQGPGAVKTLLLRQIDDALRELAAQGAPTSEPTA